MAVGDGRSPGLHNVTALHRFDRPVDKDALSAALAGATRTRRLPRKTVANGPGTVLLAPPPPPDRRALSSGVGGTGAAVAVAALRFVAGFPVLEVEEGIDG